MLALFALALQLVLSFGHVHVHGNPGEAASVLVTGAPASASPSDPTPVPADNTDDYCAICAAIHLAGSSFLPEAPQLSVPLTSRPIEHFDRLATLFIASQRTPFQSRAPPLA